jgi:hypothetical protein
MTAMLIDQDNMVIASKIQSSIGQQMKDAGRPCEIKIKESCLAPWLKKRPGNANRRQTDQGERRDHSVGLLRLRPTSRETAHDDSGCPLDRNGSARWADFRVGVHRGVVVASFFDHLE